LAGSGLAFLLVVGVGWLVVWAVCRWVVEAEALAWLFLFAFLSVAAGEAYRAVAGLELVEAEAQLWVRVEERHHAPSLLL